MFFLPGTSFAVSFTSLFSPFPPFAFAFILTNCSYTGHSRDAIFQSESMDGESWSDMGMDCPHNSFNHLRNLVLYLLEATTDKIENAEKRCGKWRCEYEDDVNRH